MANKALNVLSMDWDYFIDADGETRLMHFPDVPSENYSQSLQNIIWMNRYADDETLAKIGCKQHVASAFLKAMKNVPFVVVAESLACIYQFVVGKMRECHRKRVNLLNIDFHSDWRRDTENVDCGNWLSMLMAQYKGTYRWLRWEDSYLDSRIPKTLEHYTSEVRALREISRTAWDVLFICRSDMWSPPHLDEYFTKVFKPIIYCGKECAGAIQRGIFDSRFDSEFQRHIVNMRKVVDGFKGGSKDE